MTFRKTSLRLTACAAVLAALAPAASAKDLAYTTFADLSNAAIPPILAYDKRIRDKTGGEIGLEMYYGGSLLPAREAINGIGQGVAQAGAHIATYTPSLNPIFASIADLAFKVPDPLAVAFASTDYMLTDPEGRGEWLENNALAMLGYATTPYNILCKDEGLSSLADLKGKRIRTPGAPWARFIRSIDAVDVNIPVTELYTGLERGALDCTLAATSEVTVGTTIGPLLGSAILLDTGMFFSGSMLVYNVDTWNGFTPEQRDILLNEVAEAIVEMQVDGFIKLGNEGVAWARENGVDVTDPAPDLAAAYETFLGTIDQDVITAGKAAGVENIEQEVADFSALLVKWKELVGTVDRTDKAALLALLKTELFDKIDPETLTKR